MDNYLIDRNLLSSITDAFRYFSVITVTMFIAVGRMPSMQ